MRNRAVFAAILGFAVACGSHEPRPTTSTRLPTQATGADLTSGGPMAFHTGENGVHIVGTTRLSSTLQASGQSVRVTGRVSLHLTASETMLDKGQVQVAGFNVLYTDVPQQLIAGERKVGADEGLLGFAIETKEQQALKYDAASGRIEGELRGFIDAAYMAALVERPINDARGDVFPTPVQPALLRVTIDLRAPIDANRNQVTYLDSSVVIDLQARPRMYQKYEMPPYQISRKEFPFRLEIGGWLIFEAEKRLCVQPVRILRLEVRKGRWGWPYLYVDYTGEGLAFGQPGAAREWRKADVRFSYRGWKTLWNSSYWVVDTAGGSTSTEESNLKAEVDDDDCIEVFFIHDFDPESAHGGGATWGLGTATSKIITSDGNARGGIDLTHLAHELGHVIALPHPTANGVGVSTGTLMCPSGWMNDNPRVNSQENKDNLSNPLLTFGLTVVGPPPDCQDSADCGPCP